MYLVKIYIHNCSQGHLIFDIFVNCVRHGEGDYKGPDITCSLILNTFA